MAMTHQKETPSGLKILMIDDDKKLCRLVADYLEPMGYTVASAHDGVKGLEMAREDDFHAVILDVMFPENPSGGFELARSIHKTSAAVPILMLTAVNQRFPLGFSNNDIDADWLPIADFVEKPVDFEVLKAKLSELLAKPKSQPEA